MLVAWRAEVPAQGADGAYDRPVPHDFAGRPGPLDDDGRRAGADVPRLLEQVGAGSR